MPNINIGIKPTKCACKNENITEVTNIEASIPIFFLTAKNDAYSQSFGRIVSDKYICKPFDLNDLQKSVKEVLG